MDDLKNKKQELVNKILDKVSENFNGALNQNSLNKLRIRQVLLESKIKALLTCGRSDENHHIDLQNAYAQLKIVKATISDLEDKVDENKIFDIDVHRDDVDFTMYTDEQKEFIESQEKLDKLEQELYKK